MYKKIVFFTLFVFISSFSMIPVSEAFTLLTKEQALKEVFPSAVKVTVKSKRLKGATLETVMKKLGGRLVYEQEGSESSKVEGSKKVKFYFGVDGAGKKTGVAMIDLQPGRWGPVEFIIALNLKTGSVSKVRVMSYSEKRGRPIARLSYMRQYDGKTSNSMLEVGRDITGISGATISSRAATFAVKKALVLYEELYLKK